MREWAASDLPLVVRKAGGVRGEMKQHRTGRGVILADNSPAQWAFSQAFSGARYSLEDIRLMLERDEIPFAFATKSAEKAIMTFKRTLPPSDNVNKRGWKLCHLQGVGLRDRTPVVDVSIEVLQEHLVMLMDPANHFVIPLRWAGLGEAPEVIEALMQCEGATISVSA